MKALTVSAFITKRTQPLLSLQEMTTKERSRATIQDVAKEAGVSTATVSRVINHTGPVAQKTREVVIATIEELNFRPQSAAQILARKKTKTIGLLFQTISGDFFSPLLRGIEAAASEFDFHLLIYSTQTSNHSTENLYLPLGEQNTDGILVFMDSITKNELLHFHKIGFPVVLIHQTPPEGTAIPCVTIENKSGARMIVDHLIDVHNYRRIAYLSGNIDQEDYHWRELGYRESLANHNIAFDPELVSSASFDQEQAQVAVENWLTNGVKFDAIFASDDKMAIGVLAALDQANLKVPEDIALVGFDDIDLSRFLNPPLTTVKAPIEQVGREAICLLVKQITGKITKSLVLLPTELVIRKSCGCN